MIKSQLLLLILMSTFLVFSQSCGKKASTVSSGSITSGSTIEIIPIPNHNVKKIDLGIADSFAIIAYTSIASTPTSTISGKVGLKPGARSLINLNSATEVSGGSEEVYAGDDVGDPADYLSIARDDLIEAYRDAVARPTDRDKMEAYEGKLGGKILPPGIYRWSNGVTIDSDITLEGSDTDVFIFQITENMSVAPKVRVILKGGVRPRNIFWQVSGRVTLEANSLVPGTIMSQLTFEMKPLSHINGRAFVKNGKLLLNQSVIIKPGID